MKLQGYLKGTGKLGNIVVSRVAGQTIARDYNPNVANPNTIGQVTTRSKLKLASQLAQSLADVIAIPKAGLVSARNSFISQNFDLISVADGTAEISLSGVQLTKSNIGLAPVTASPAGASLTLRMQTDVQNVADRIVYSVFKKGADGALQPLGSRIVEDAGADGRFQTSFNGASGVVVVYAYGIKDKDGAATAKYSNLEVNDAVTLARLVATRAISTDDYRFTKTSGVVVDSEDEVAPGA